MAVMHGGLCMIDFHTIRTGNNPALMVHVQEGGVALVGVPGVPGHTHFLGLCTRTMFSICPKMQ